MTHWARIVGICIQGLVLGLLLFQAILYLAGTVSGAKAFQYQGF